MNCEDCQSLVEEYFDQELAGAVASEVVVHLEMCPSCSLVLKQLTAELSTYQKYERKLEVTPALWSNVQLQLADKRKAESRSHFGAKLVELLSPFFKPKWATSLALALFAVLGIVVGISRLSKEPQSPGRAALLANAKAGIGATSDNLSPQVVTAIDQKNSSSKGNLASVVRPQRKSSKFLSSASERAPASLPQVVRNAEKNYLNAIALMSRDARRRQGTLDSATQARLNGALTAIDRTILNTRKVVQQNPDDAVAVQYMLSAYDKKVDFLREMGRF